MKANSILKIFLIIIFIIGTLNIVYANGGPQIGPNQVKTSAQNYLNSNNLTYTADTPGWADLRYEVKDTTTGELKWIPENLIAEDGTSFSGRYKMTDYWPTWIVQINDKNGKNAGQLYVDANTAQVLKVVINDKVLKDVLNQREQLTEDFYESTTDENISENYEYPVELINFIDIIYPITMTSQLLPLNNPIHVIFLIVAISWMYSPIWV